MSGRLIHMIGNAHIDPVWLWQWPEGYQEVRATFRSALDRMEEYPDFIFTSDSVLFFQWIEETDPELFAQVRESVAKGRFQIIGGWWIEPDCNIPSGESYVRHALYGQRWLRDRFGITATTGANLDSFGHNSSIPQILHKAGMDSYVFLRPGPNENANVPGPVFRWESPDGSQVLAYRIPHEYCAPRDDLGEHVEKALASLPPERDELMVFYGVGNHGGGPTKANLDSIARLNGNRGLRLELSSVRRFFDSLGEGGDLPVHAGELQHHGVGCYTSHSGIKRWNRRAENLLQRAEKWAAVADVLGAQAYPLEQLTEAWKLLLFNQFHDTLAGTSIEPAYEDARDQIGHASSLAGLAFNRAIQSISRQIEIPQEEGMTPIVVFNAHPWRLRTDVELEYNALASEGAHLGDGVPLQLTRPLTTMSSSRSRLVFPADVPPLGYRVYRLYQGAIDSEEAVTASRSSLENDHLVLELNPASGRIVRLVHKASGVDLAAANARHAVVVDDPSDTWGHGVSTFDDELGEFEPTKVRLVENGPVRAILRVESRWGDSTLREDYVLGANAAYVDVRVTVDWHEQLKLLKLRYPTSVQCERATFEVPYGQLERAAGGDEEPGQAWVDVSDGSGGLAVLNDAKYGYDVRGGDIGISAVRSPVWAWHDPRELEQGGDFEYMDQGKQSFTVRLVPHAGDWRGAAVARLAAELNQPHYALLETQHEGPLPQEASFVVGGEGSVVVSVLKAAEDGDGALIVRAYESGGTPASARIELQLLDRTIEAEFAANEIKTFRVPRDPAEPVAEVNLLEW